jgi:hypothetical protein
MGELNAVDVDAFVMIRNREPDASGPLACSAAPHPYPSRFSAVPGRKDLLLEVGHDLVGTEVPPEPDVPLSVDTP